MLIFQLVDLLTLARRRGVDFIDKALQGDPLSIFFVVVLVFLFAYAGYKKFTANKEQDNSDEKEDQ